MDPNYLAADYDLKILIAGLRQGRDILAAQAFKPWLGEERMPGPAVQSDAELEDFIRATAETEYHPVGTCKMGKRSDGGGRRETARARHRAPARDRRLDHADVVSGNTNAPVIMIAEKGAEMMLAVAGEKKELLRGGQN